MLGRQKRFHTYVIKKNTVLRALTAAGALIAVIALVAAARPMGNAAGTLLLKASIDAAIPGVKAAQSEENYEQRRDTLHRLLSGAAIFVSGFDPALPHTVFADSVPIFRQYLSSGTNAVISAEKPAFNGKNADTAPTSEPVPQKPEPGRLPIEETNTPSENLVLRNETTYQIDTAALLARPLSFDLSGDGPHVLIIHTHASEAYTPTEQNSYSPSDPSRTEDTAFNTVRVGDELEQELKNRGVRVIHDRGINDYPSYNKSYTKTLSVIEQYLAQYPSIQMVFDLHRDAVVRADGTKIKFTADIAGEKVAQVMLVCGTNQGGLPNDSWQENLTFALHLQSRLESLYPGFARPLNLRKERFNMHATKGSLIFEVGTNGNTLEEAVAATKYLAEAISQTLKNT